MKITFRLAALEKAALSKPAGYLETIISVADSVTEDTVILDGDVYRRLAVLFAAPNGLGDRLAAVAQPIAKAIDWLLGTDIENCQGCKDRRAWLNSRFPGR